MKVNIIFKIILYSNIPINITLTLFCLKIDGLKILSYKFELKKEVESHRDRYTTSMMEHRKQTIRHKLRYP